MDGSGAGRPTHRNGFTSLHLAAKLGQRDVAGALVKGGASLDARTSDGVTYKFNRPGSYPASAAIRTPAGATPLAVALAVERQSPWTDLRLTTGGHTIGLLAADHERMLGVISFLRMAYGASPVQ